MKRSKQDGLGTRFGGRRILESGSRRVDLPVIMAIEDSLIEELGADLALAVRVCLDSSLALRDPLAYAEILGVMVGGDGSERVLRAVKKKLVYLTRELSGYDRFSFSDTVERLRNRYSTDVLLGSR